MLRILAAVAAVAVGATAVYAQNAAVVKERRETMRGIGKASAALFRMNKGDTPFDLATVQSSLTTFQTNAQKMKGLFSDDSKTGGTDASPMIWAKRADFDAVIDKWVAVSKAAEAAIKDEASFKAEYPKVAENCGGCHKASDGFAPGLSDSFKRMREPL
jgi:cytochrome c556